MTAISWSFVEAAARLLEGDEREAVLGDLRETGESGLRGRSMYSVSRSGGNWRFGRTGGRGLHRSEWHCQAACS